MFENNIIKTSEDISVSENGDFYISFYDNNFNMFDYKTEKDSNYYFEKNSLKIKNEVYSYKNKK